MKALCHSHQHSEARIPYRLQPELIAYQRISAILDEVMSAHLGKLVLVAEGLSQVFLQAVSDLQAGKFTPSGEAFRELLDEHFCKRMPDQSIARRPVLPCMQP